MGCFVNTVKPELIKDGFVKVDVSSIGTKFENFVQAGCRDLGSHLTRNMYCPHCAKNHLIVERLS